MMKNDYYNSEMIQSFSDSLQIDSDSVIRYHYTSPEAFLSIMKSRRVRFSDIRYMNDKSEGIYFVKLLLEFMEANRHLYPNAQEAINLLLDQNDFEDIKALKVSSIKFKDFLKAKYKTDRIFLLCASAKPDLLNMWNYYIHNSSYEGYSIGFNIARLLKTFDSTESNVIDPFTVYYGDILYDEKKQTAEISDLVKHVENYAAGPQEEDLAFAAIILRQYIETRGYFFKHKAFKAEEEFRVIVSISQERIGKTKSNWVSNMRDMEAEFFTRNGLIVPGFTIPISNDAISRIYLSPTAEYDIAKQGVQELITLNGYKGIQIRKSNIPIRY